MAPGDDARSGGRPKSNAGKGGKGDSAPHSKRAAAQEVKKPQEARRPEKVEKPPKAGKEVTVSHETLLRRVKEARGTALVVLAARAIGGGLITLLTTGCVLYFVAFLLPPIRLTPLFLLANLAAASGMVFGAWTASAGGLPESASGLAFLRDRAFIWVDPFREERAHLLPSWLEAILWAPTQVLAGAIPFLRVKRTGEADAEAAAGFARRTVEEGEVRLDRGSSWGSAEARGLRLLLLLRLARLVIKDGALRARVSGLGQTALFEGPIA